MHRILVPVDIGDIVLRWLRQDQDWLLVIDNLDIIEIVDGFLPEPGPQRHTIITTRNPNAEGIPAGGIEAPLLEPDEAIDLLSTLSSSRLRQILRKGNMPMKSSKSRETSP